MEAEAKNFTLTAKDGTEVIFNTSMTKYSKFLTTLVGDFPDIEKESIPFENGSVLKKINEYLTRHINVAPTILQRPLKEKVFEKNVSEWDAKFLDVDIDQLLALLAGSMFFEIDYLTELISAKIGLKIKGKTPEEIEDEFDLNNFTNEDDDEIDKQTQWCVDNI